MKSSTILREFVGTVCSACGGSKQPNTGFCGRCYHRLPSHMKSALWNRFGSGFEEAFDAASKHLAETDPRNKQGRLPLDG
jgi:hypothetical protein